MTPNAVNQGVRPQIVADRLCRDFLVKRRTPRDESGTRRWTRGRTRERIRAVDGVGFTIAAGEMVGYIGPNGAGKSTTLKMMTGILTPTAGTIRVGGIDPSRERTRLARRLGVVFGQRTSLWWDLPLQDSFALLQRLYRVDPTRHRANLAAYVDMLDLGGQLATPVRQLSLGQRMRGDIIAAPLHDPEILFLDEPTIGLDLVSKARLREFLRALNAERGVTLVLTTHDLDDIEALCDRVIVIDHGRLVFDGSQQQLHALPGGERTLIVDLATPAPALEIPGSRTVKVEGARQWLSFPAGESAATLIAAVVAAHDVVDLSVREPEIEDVIHRIYREAAAR